MEMILPDKSEMLMRIDEMMQAMNYNFKRLIHNKAEKLEYLNRIFKTHSFEAKIAINEKEIDLLTKRFEQSFKTLVDNRQNKIENLANDLNFSMKKLLHVKENTLSSIQGIYRASDPSLALKEGFAQVVVAGKRSSLKALHVEDVFELHSAKEILSAKVLDKKSF
jgi:exodeoxyribonuclease VII large subunit